MGGSAGLPSWGQGGNTLGQGGKNYQGYMKGAPGDNQTISEANPSQASSGSYKMDTNPGIANSLDPSSLSAGPEATSSGVPWSPNGTGMTTPSYGAPGPSS